MADTAISRCFRWFACCMICSVSHFTDKLGHISLNSMAFVTGSRFTHCYDEDTSDGELYDHFTKNLFSFIDRHGCTHKPACLLNAIIRKRYSPQYDFHGPDARRSPVGCGDCSGSLPVCFCQSRHHEEHPLLLRMR